MINKLSRKVTIVLVTIVLYCTLISAFIYIFDPRKYLDFTTLWLTFFVISAPMFLIVGVAMSFLFDYFELKANIKGIVYTIVAGILVLPYNTLIFPLTWSNVIAFFIFGAIGGFLLFIVQSLFDKFIYRKNNKEVYD